MLLHVQTFCAVPEYLSIITARMLHPALVSADVSTEFDSNQYVRTEMGKRDVSLSQAIEFLSLSIRIEVSHKESKSLSSIFCQEGRVC